MKTRTYRAVSLFSNCGAGDVGYCKAGFKFQVMAELDQRRLDVCLLNHPEAAGVQGDLRKTWPNVVSTYRKRFCKRRPHLLAACPPCQGMSSARSGRGKENDADAGSKEPRNLLVVVISKVAKKLQPDLIVVENVPAFLTRKIWHPRTKQPISAAALLLEELSDDYIPFPIVVDLCDFGVPQTRKRTFITLVRRKSVGFDRLVKEQLYPYPVPRFSKDFGGRPITIRKALSRFKLPSLDASSREAAAPQNGHPLHQVPFWNDRRYPMVAAIPPHSGKGAWENKECEHCGNMRPSAEDVLCPHCLGPLLRPLVLEPTGWRFVNGFRNSSYTRMHSNKPAATITTASGHIGSDHTIHPYENRLLSTLECARLQTFPSAFNWGSALEDQGHTNVREMIGEAVPPLFTAKHGRVLKQLLERTLPKKLLPATNARAVSALKKLGIHEKPQPASPPKTVSRR